MRAKYTTVRACRGVTSGDDLVIKVVWAYSPECALYKAFCPAHSRIEPEQVDAEAWLADANELYIFQVKEIEA